MAFSAQGVGLRSAAREAAAMIETSPPIREPAVANSLVAGPFGTLMRAMHDAILMIDESQRIVALNPAAQRLLRCEAAEVLGASLERFVPLAWRTRHAEWVRGFAASQALQHQMGTGRRVDVLRGDGSTVPVEIQLSRIEMVEGGQPRTLFAAMVRDTSESCALEEQLALLERRMRAVFELSPVAIWICDNDDVIAFANCAAARLFEVESIEPLIGRRIWTLLNEESHALLQSEIERAQVGQAVGAIVSASLTRMNGQRREVEIALAALPDHGHRTVQMVVSDVTEHRREAAELDHSRRALRELSSSVVEAREEERRRIARELHDELGQRLTALKIDLATLATQIKQPGYGARVASMQATLDDTLASVRRIASNLRPLMLDDLGLVAAIEWLAHDMARRMGVPVHTRLPLQEPVVNQRVATALYRMVQEALTNVARHAHAKSVQVALHAQDGKLVLTVADDGVGLSDQALQRTGSFGLMGLRERAHMLGGEIDIGHQPGGGTRVTVSLPADPGAHWERRR